MPVSSLAARNLLAFGFAFVGGWADVICLVRYNAYAGMQTGNVVMTGKSIAATDDGPAETWFYFAVVLCNMGGVVCFEMVQWCLVARCSGRHSTATCLALPIAAMLVACDVLDMSAGTSKWHVCLPAAAFGCQNALVSGADSLGLPTTIMTGHVGKVGKCLVMLLKAQGRRKDISATCRTYGVSLVVLIATATGAIAAALIIRRGFNNQGSSWCFIPAAALLVILLGVTGWLERQQGNKANQVPEIISRGPAMEKGTHPNLAAC